MHIRSLFIIALLGMGTVSPALAQAPAVGTDLWKECQSQQSDQALKACTAIIDAKSEPAPKLAQAYNMRALAHQRMGQPDKAIAHYGGDPAWATVRPPLVDLGRDPAAALVTELDRRAFSMPGLKA